MNEILLTYIPHAIVVAVISFSVSFILLIKPERKINHKDRHTNLKK
jgi:hypothetical protein